MVTLLCASVSLAEKQRTGHSSGRGLVTQDRHCRLLIYPPSSTPEQRDASSTDTHRHHTSVHTCSQEPGWGRPVSTRTTSTHAHAGLLKAVTHFTDSDTEAGRHLGCSTPAQSRHSLGERAVVDPALKS